MNMLDLLQEAVQKGASDIFLISNLEPSFRINSKIERVGEEKLKSDDVELLVREIYRMAKNRNVDKLFETGDDDFSFSVSGLGRFRTNTALQRGSLSVVIRTVSFEIPDYQAMRIPEKVMSLAASPKGLVLITGAAGSGKSTTLACIMNKINTERASHIITMEDPIEFLHSHKKSIVTQREIGGDTQSYVTALRAVLRQSPDVILIGEMRDFETIDIAMTAAEAGQLLFSTLHTTGAANTIDRIVDIFPVNQQQQIRLQLSMVLQAVVSQQLIQGVDGNLVPVFEIMTMTPAIRNMIREAKTHQIDSAIYSGAAEGMQTMDGAILSAYNAGAISAENALLHSLHPEEMKKRM